MLYKLLIENTKNLNSKQWGIDPGKYHSRFAVAYPGEAHKTRETKRRKKRYNKGILDKLKEIYCKYGIDTFIVPEKKKIEHKRTKYKRWIKFK